MNRLSLVKTPVLPAAVVLIENASRLQSVIFLTWPPYLPKYICLSRVHLCRWMVQFVLGTKKRARGGT